MKRVEITKGEWEYLREHGFVIRIRTVDLKEPADGVEVDPVDGSWSWWNTNEEGVSLTPLIYCFHPIGPVGIEVGLDVKMIEENPMVSCRVWTDSDYERVRLVSTEVKRAFEISPLLAGAYMLMENVLLKTYGRDAKGFQECANLWCWVDRLEMVEVEGNA